MGSIGQSERLNDGQVTGRRVYLVTSPRTASNLFVKILNIYEQPNAATSAHHGGYFFMPAFLNRDNVATWDIPTSELTPQQKELVGADLQAGADNMRQQTEAAEQAGKIMFVKEHANLMTKPELQDQIIHDHALSDTASPPWTIHIHKEIDTHSQSNPTFMPDNWLTTFVPTFLIRHPVLQIPSLYRATSESRGPVNTASDRAVLKANYSLLPIRQLYDFYVSHFQSEDPSSPWPLLIDSNDLISHPATVMKRFCQLTGLDFTKCQFNWEKASKEKLDALGSDVQRRFLSTINASTGIIASKAPMEIDLDAEAVKWKEEFGEEMGSIIEELVRAAMPHYMYLHARRWCPVGKDGDYPVDGEIENLDAMTRPVELGA